MKEQDWDFSDLLLDDSFVEHVNDPSRSESFLQKLKSDFPEKVEEIGMAVAVLQGIENKKGQYSLQRKHRLWNRIARNKNRSYKLYPLRIAAGIMLVIGLGALIFYTAKKPNQLEMAAESFKTDSLIPGLFFSDGRKIYISGDESLISYSDDGGQVEINDTALVRQEVKQDVFNQLVVPYGKNVSVILSDGTKVWVHSGSRLVYPAAFDGNKREVYLYGEAYFEVTANAERPFTVRTDEFNTQVTGTKFSVQAFEDDDLYATVLLEGQVKLSGRKNEPGKEIVLKPGQRGSVTWDHRFDVNKLEHPENAVSWVYGHLIFYDEALDQLLGRVSRYYNIEIVVPERIPSKLVTGKLDLKEDPARVLTGIAAIANLRFAVENNEYKLYQK